MENKLQTEEKLSINKYFQDSSNSDIFDQISKLNITRPTENEIASMASSEVSKSVDSHPKADATFISKEPVICRIFASNEETVAENNKKLQGEAFFDTLGSGPRNSSTQQPSESTFNTNQLSYSSTLPREFPREGSRFRPSSGTDVDNDAVNDDTFMAGASHVFVPSSCSSYGEQDRRRDAWIPSNRTRQALIAAATAPPGTYVLDKDLMTMPGVVLQEDMFDNVHEAVNHYLGEIEAAQRKVLTSNDVTQDERGLRELIQAECYRAAVNLTSRLLTMYGQGIGRAGFPSKHTLHSIQLWFTRISLLVKLRSWSVAWAEAEPWWDLDRPDLYFQFYSELYGGRPGTIVPFSFRLLLAELPQYVHKPQEAFKRLFSILSVVRQILQNLENNLSEDGSHIEINDRDESKRLWKSRETRILHSLVNLAFQQKDFKLAIDIMNGLINETSDGNGIQQRRALLSALGRIFLQLGDLKAAKQWFEKSKALKLDHQNEGASSPDFLELVDCGLFALADSNYEKGCEYFQNASAKDPTNIMVKNNIAVCLLHCGKQKEAVNLLEAVINLNPTAGLQESLLMNLSTLYELESSTAMDNKYKMLQLVSKYKGDAVSLHCLKLQIKND